MNIRFYMFVFLFAFIPACKKEECENAWKGYFKTADDVLRQVTGQNDCCYIYYMSGKILNNIVIDSFETDYVGILDTLTGEIVLQPSLEAGANGNNNNCIDWKLSGNTYKIYHPDKFGPDTVTVQGAIITNF
jgi:hypothetical protein